MSNSAVLILKIDYFDQPDARESGRILDRLGLAFAFLGDGDSRLTVSRVEIGSLIVSLEALFKVGDAIVKAIEAKNALTEFVSTLVSWLETTRQANVGRIPAVITNLFIELATPISRGRASGAQIYVYGDNANVFVMGQPEAEMLATALANRAKSGELAPELLNLAHITESDDDERYPTPAKSDATDLSSLAIPTPEGAPKLYHATAVTVNEEWYAGSDELGGLLIPLQHSSILTEMQKFRRYHVKGKLVREGDRLVFAITNMDQKLQESGYPGDWR